MDLLVYLLYLAVLSWWDAYLRTVESPDLLGSLVALTCSIYLVHFTIISLLGLFLGPVNGLHEESK